MENKSAETIEVLREREHSLEWRLLGINEKYTR